MLGLWKRFRSWFPDNPGMYTRPEGLSLLTFCCIYISSVVYLLFGWLHRYIIRYFSKEHDLEPKTPQGYAPLFDDFGAFYSRYLFGRICDCWNRPICSTPGAYINIMERTGSNFLHQLKPTGRTKRCLNLGSYNYLGFAENTGRCTTSVVEAIKEHSLSPCSTRTGLGTSSLHRELEQLIAKFLGKEDAVVFGMGYATNSTSLPGIIGNNCLIISDSINHASLVMGMKRSGATVRQFEHNNTVHLEQLLRQAIIEGQVKPWKKILIVVEGIYSMEGAILPLPEIVRLKKKYKAYLYVDEAHSIGALGNKGGGVCDYYGIDTSEVDILMGTFTKSFGSAGGYIASSKKLIQQINVCSFASVHDTAMPVACTQQVISCLRIIMGLDGTNEGSKKLAALKQNTNYFRSRMRELGFRTIGNHDSPVVPVMIYLPSTMAAFCRMCQENGIGCVVASYPATPIFLCRARFCISASHTIDDLERAIKVMENLGNVCGIRYDQKRWSTGANFNPKIQDGKSSDEAVPVNGKYNHEKEEHEEKLTKNGERLINGHHQNGKYSNGFHP